MDTTFRYGKRSDIQKQCTSAFIGKAIKDDLANFVGRAARIPWNSMPTNTRLGSPPSVFTTCYTL